MSRTKFEFDDLPPNSRSLIIATLGLEIASSNCKNIFDLARKRHQTVDEVWRSICRKTAQPICTIPGRVLETEYNSAPNNATATAVPSRASAAPADSAKAVAVKAASAKAGASKPLAANAGAPAPPATSASVASASRARSTQNWRAALAVGLVTGTLLGVGIAILGHHVPAVADRRRAADRSHSRRRRQVRGDQVRLRSEQRSGVPGHDPAYGLDQQDVLEAITRRQRHCWKAGRRRRTSSLLARDCDHAITLDRERET